METIWLQRSSGEVPWGFRLQGGREFAQPLSVQKVGIHNFYYFRKQLSYDAFMVNLQQMKSIRALFL